MSENKINLTSGDELKTYNVNFSQLQGEACPLCITANPNDTVKSFINKLLQTWYIEYLDKDDTKFLPPDSKGTKPIYGVKLMYRQLVINQSEAKSVGEYFSNPKEVAISFLYIYDKPDTSIYDDPGKACDDVFPLADAINSKAVKKDDEIQESLGTLPLYRVVPDENSTNSGNKYRFQKTKGTVKLSTKRKEIEYEGFNVGRKESQTLEATNPLHRFICSDHLEKQKNEGRLANAQEICNRTVAGFRDDKNNEVSKLRGWQGINANDYVVPHPIGKSGVAESKYKDAKDWYTTLSNILLDKAYLSEDENLDILISDAKKIFDAGKIDLKQFSNVILMLRYAYELRKLPNERNGELNSDIASIKLKAKSHRIVTEVCKTLVKKLENLWDDFKKENNLEITTDASYKIKGSEQKNMTFIKDARYAFINEVAQFVYDKTNKYEKFKKEPQNEFKNIEEYVEMLNLAQYVLGCIKSSGELTIFQKVINLILSLFHFLEYRYYPIGTDQLQFDNTKDIFAKYNDPKNKEKTFHGIPEDVFIELYNR